jgi:hypothetical protein
MLGWATAWSFDRLRLWLEQRVDPRSSLERALIRTVACWALGFVWLYQGLVPKLLFPDTGERAILMVTELFQANMPLALAAVGCAEMLLGLLLLLPSTAGWGLRITLWVLPVLFLGGMLTARNWMATPFNAPSLLIAMLGLVASGMALGGEIPSAARCLRTPSKKAATPQ